MDFTGQKQKGSEVHLITCCSLCSFSEKEASSSSGVMSDRFIHIESTSVCLSLPPVIILFSRIFSLVSSVWSGVTVGSALQGTYSLQGVTTLLCINQQLQASVFDHHKPELCSEGAHV